MVDHGQMIGWPWSQIDHGQLIMVGIDHGQLTMVGIEHGQFWPWSELTMVNMTNHLTMVKPVTVQHYFVKI